MNARPPPPPSPAPSPRHEDTRGTEPPSPLSLPNLNGEILPPLAPTDTEPTPAPTPPVRSLY